MKINGREISRNFPPYVIAEVSANHNGSIDTALETILEAKKSGADAVKIQTYTPETMTIDCNSEDFLIKDGLWKDRTLFDLYSEAYTPFEWHDKLFNYARSIDITLFSSPFDESAVDLLDKLNTPAYKVASFELVDLPLIKYIASKKKPILMSTGMANIEEIGSAIETAKNAGASDIAIFHCISSYPASIDQAHLNNIDFLKKEFGIEIGLSDHTIGNTAAIVATAKGATLIEKHFILSRDFGGVDSTFSIEPNEMKILVNEVEKAHSSLGNEDFSRSDTEKTNKIFRRSLYYVNELAEGSILSDSDIRRIRPGFGLSPKYFDEVIGKKLKKKVKRGDRVNLNDFY